MANESTDDRISVNTEAKVAKYFDGDHWSTLAYQYPTAGGDLIFMGTDSQFPETEYKTVFGKKRFGTEAVAVLLRDAIEGGKISFSCELEQRD